MGMGGGSIAGVAYATARSLPASYTMRAGIYCGALAAPFFAMREVVAASMSVDGPVASAITGGFAGYFGALFWAGPHWKTLSHSAMVMGVGCGFLDIVMSGLDWKRKVFLVNRHDAAVKAVAESASGKDQGASLTQINWPVWFPVVKEIDEEYEELLRRQQATVLALEEEQARIAVLLNALESVKAGKQIRDAELAEAGLRTTGESAVPASISSVETKGPP